MARTEIVCPNCVLGRIYLDDGRSAICPTCKGKRVVRTLDRPVTELNVLLELDRVGARPTRPTLRLQQQ